MTLGTCDSGTVDYSDECEYGYLESGNHEPLRKLLEDVENLGESTSAVQWNRVVRQHQHNSTLHYIGIDVLQYEVCLLRWQSYACCSLAGCTVYTHRTPATDDPGLYVDGIGDHSTPHTKVPSTAAAAML